jgi:hypothetical protein
MTHISDIQNLPTVVDNNHESLYRSYHILNHVLKMVKRGDKAESIIEMAELMKHIKPVSPVEK